MCNVKNIVLRLNTNFTKDYYISHQDNILHADDINADLMHPYYTLCIYKKYFRFILSILKLTPLMYIYLHTL